MAIRLSSNWRAEIFSVPMCSARARARSNVVTLLPVLLIFDNRDIRAANKTDAAHGIDAPALF